MSEPEYVYRVVREDGGYIHEGRGSDPFSNPASAKRRATKLTNESKRYSNNKKKYKVQRAVVVWEDV